MHRAEVFYDCLLPWLKGEPIDIIREVSKKSWSGGGSSLPIKDQEDRWRSPARSATSAFKATMEALRFYMSRKCGEKGVLQEENTLHGELKKLTFLVRWQLLDAVQEDLQVLLPAPPLTLSLFQSLLHSTS